jgi:alkanesulfonate monooxygenase SsuD/methylene tetrahydromethanopterin reductase-like flavin-dependent oxidoreductase (luciferase family)
MSSRFNASTLSNQPFHASVIQGGAPDGPTLTTFAQHLESLGFDAIVLPDAPGRAPAVLPTLAWIAASTSTLQVGSQVLNNDVRHPLQVARDAATVHALSGSRVILGMGTGHPNTGDDLRQFGIPLDPPGQRVTRFEHAIGIIKALFADETVSVSDQNYTMDGARLDVPLPDESQPTLLIAAGGPRMLAFAGDVIHPMVQRRFPQPITPEITDNAPAFLMGDSAAILAGLERLRSDLGITRIVLPPELIDPIAPVLAAARAAGTA